MRLGIGCYRCAGIVGFRGDLRYTNFICVGTKNAREQRDDHDLISPEFAFRHDARAEVGRKVTLLTVTDSRRRCRAVIPKTMLPFCGESD